MANRSKRERLKAFLLRRKLNAFGLLTITAGSLIITLIAGLCGFAHTDILALVTLLLVVLCFVQAYRMRASFRTMRAFRGFRKKKTH
ncbi:MAG: hypothetical protein ACI4PG_04390 [Candidatus Ventricola sp.]